MEYTMNLYELNAMINSLDPIKDAELIAFYEVKRTELVAIIERNIIQELSQI
jgi:hypothetical protein